MTKLEEEIRTAILSNIYKETVDEMTEVEKEGVAHAAAEVAKRYIEKALKDASAGTLGSMPTVQRVYIETWFEENGIV